MGGTFSRLYRVITLFDKTKIVENFRNMNKIGFPIRVAKGSSKVANFIDKRSECILPESFVYEGQKIQTADYLRDYWVTGMVVLRGTSDPTKAELLHEEYFRGNTPENKVISWSMGKSMLSCLFGIAIQEGTIRSINDLVTDYAPELMGTGYDGVILKDVLQMSSGVRFDENYANFFSDIHAFGRSLALGSSINALAKALPKQRPPATYNHYNSMDTQVLGIVLTNAISKVGFANLTQYLQEKVWSKGGFEDDLYWLLDNENNQMEIAVGTMNARTRDYARFGWLYLNQGKSPVDGTSIVNSEWVRQSVTPDAPHLMPGKNNISDYEFGYGFQWWVLGKEDAPTEVAGDYLAAGVYNQFIYVNPQENIVIARNSAYPHYDTDELPSENKAIAFFRAVAKANSSSRKNEANGNSTRV